MDAINSSCFSLWLLNHCHALKNIGLRFRSYCDQQAGINSHTSCACRWPGKAHLCPPALQGRRCRPARSWGLPGRAWKRQPCPPHRVPAEGLRWAIAAGRTAQRPPASPGPASGPLCQTAPHCSSQLQVCPALPPLWNYIVNRKSKVQPPALALKVYHLAVKLV